MPETNWDSVRAEFPALSHWTFLNTATFGQLPRRCGEAIRRHLERRDELACSDFLNWFDDMERVRESAARLVNCSAGDIAFIPNASTALGLLLGGIDWRAGDRIVALEDEFPNLIYGPRNLAARGVEFVTTSWEGLPDHVNERTRLVALSSANYNTGFAPPIEAASPWIHERGALLFVDGTQSVGALRFDVARARPDMLAVHAYKWLLSPNGAGFVYVSPELRQTLAPAVVGWRSHENWRDVDNLHHGSPLFSPRAERYEGGGVSFALLYAMGAAIDLNLEIGPEAIERRVLELAARTRIVLRELGASVAEYRSPIVAARFDRDPSPLARALKERRILVAARKGYLRVSPHLYNNESDLGIFERELRPLIRR